MTAESDKALLALKLMHLTPSEKLHLMNGVIRYVNVASGLIFSQPEAPAAVADVHPLGAVGGAAVVL